MSVYGYVRVSTARQADVGLSLEVQRRQIEGYCQMRGLALDRVFVEEGVSGGVPTLQRAVAGPLLDVAAAGDHVVVAKLDRIFRSAVDALQIVERLKARSIGLHLIDLGGDVCSNGVSKLFLTIVAAFAEAERDRISERAQQVKDDQRARGMFVGGGRGRPPFGYRLEPIEPRGSRLVPDEAALALLPRMRRWRREGASYDKIARLATERGCPASRDTVRRVLTEGIRDDVASVRTAAASPLDREQVRVGP